VLGNATEDGDRVQTNRACDGLNGAVNLHGELTGRSQDQGARGTSRLAVLATIVLHETLDNGGTEGDGLAGSGLSATQDILAGENVGDGCGLDGERRGRTHCGELTRDVVTNTEVTEADADDIGCHGCLSFETLENDVIFGSKARLLVTVGVEVRRRARGTVATTIAVEAGTLGAVATTEGWALVAVVTKGARGAISIGRTLGAVGAIAIGCGTVTIGGTRRSLAIRGTLAAGGAVTIGRAVAAGCAIARCGTVTIGRSRGAISVRRTFVAVAIGGTCGTVTVCWAISATSGCSAVTVCWAVTTFSVGGTVATRCGCTAVVTVAECGARAAVTIGWAIATASGCTAVVTVTKGGTCGTVTIGGAVTTGSAIARCGTVTVGRSRGAISIGGTVATAGGCTAVVTIAEGWACGTVTIRGTFAATGGCSAVTVGGGIATSIAFAGVPTVLAGSVFLGAVTAVAFDAATRSGAGLFGTETGLEVLCRTTAGGLLEIRHDSVLG